MKGQWSKVGSSTQRLLLLDFDLNINLLHIKGIMICYENFHDQVHGYDIYWDIFEKRLGEICSQRLLNKT